MSLFKFKNIAIMAAMGLMLLVVGSSDVNAQTRREIERERQRIEREQRRISRQRQQQNDRGYRVTERRVDNANYNHGYQQGLLAGQYDRRRGKYNQSNVYRGTGAYPNGGDPTSSDYIYRQGYLQGYNDGFYGGRNY